MPLPSFLSPKLLVLILGSLLCLYTFYQLGQLYASHTKLPASSTTTTIQQLLTREQLLHEFQVEKAKTQAKQVAKLDPSLDAIATDDEEDHPKIETLAWKPRVQYYRGFITDEEANHIMQMVLPILTESTVVGAGGKNVKSDHRTSTGAFIVGAMRDDEVIKDVERRIALWTHLPEENGEALYVLRYDLGQYYRPHNDYFLTDEMIRNHGDRVATVLTYLAAPDEGGETQFPDTGMRVKFHKGDALLFWDYNPDMTPDPWSKHESLPVTKGTKWCMTKWIHSKRY